MLESFSQRSGAAVMVVEVDVAAHEPEEVFKPLGSRTDVHRVAEVPLADKTRCIAVVLQQLWERLARNLEWRRRPADDIIDQITLLISSVDQPRARGTTQH